MPYVERYFADALTIWGSKTYKIAEYLLVGLYPINLASTELVAATKKYLANTDFADKAAFKRMIVENLAGVERALVAQERDLRK